MKTEKLTIVLLLITGIISVTGSAAFFNLKMYDLSVLCSLTTSIIAVKLQLLLFIKKEIEKIN